MKKFLLVFVLLIIAFFVVHEVVVKPFPFIQMVYTADENKWESAPSTSAAPYKLFVADKDFPKSLHKKLEKYKKASLEDKISWAVSYTRTLQSHSRGNGIRNEQNIFSSSAQFLRSCSESSKIFVALLSGLDVPGRVIWMNSHTVSEVYDNGRWILIDSHGNVRAFDSAGTPLSLLQTIMHFDRSLFRKVIEAQNDDLPDYLTARHALSGIDVYAQQSWLVYIPGQSLFDFHLKNRSFWHIMHSVLGNKEQAVGEGLQFVFPDRVLLGNVGVNIFRRWTWWSKKQGIALSNKEKQTQAHNQSNKPISQSE